MSMYAKYQKAFITRRSIIQAIYANLSEFDPNLIENSLEAEHMLSEIKIDNNLFSLVLQNVLEEWDLFENTYNACLKKHDFKSESLSRCAQAVLRGAYAELRLDQSAKNIIINEYVELAKLFCVHEAKFVNKILDVFANQVLQLDYSPALCDS